MKGETTPMETRLLLLLRFTFSFLVSFWSNWLFIYLFFDEFSL